jgi:hypothetical protein
MDPSPGNSINAIKAGHDRAVSSSGETPYMFDSNQASRMSSCSAERSCHPMPISPSPSGRMHQDLQRLLPLRSSKNSPRHSSAACSRSSVMSCSVIGSSAGFRLKLDNSHPGRPAQ